MFVGIGQGGAARRPGDSHMHQPSQAAARAVTDLAQRIGDELRPAGKAFGGTLGSVLLDESGELGTGKVLEQLIEEACDLYDCVALLWAAFGETPRQGMARQRSIIGGHTPYFRLQEPVLDKGECDQLFCLRIALTAVASDRKSVV